MAAAAPLSLADQLAARRTQLKQATPTPTSTSTQSSSSNASSSSNRVTTTSSINDDNGVAAMAAIHERVRAADLPSWYTKLSDCTYPSVFMDLSIEVPSRFARDLLGPPWFLAIHLNDDVTW
jgi:hypothetical protein